MDKVLFFSILLVFVGALVGSVVQHRRVDRVLKDLRGFHVTARIQDKRIWGRFNLFSNAIEFIFSRPYSNRRGNLLTSFIIFSEQMSDVDVIFRFHDELTPKNQKRRLKEIEQIKHPSIIRRIRRSIRNFMVAFREAIDESIGLLMSRVQKKSSSMLQGQDDYLKKIRTNTLGAVSTAAYDPVLEHYINHRVVLEAGKKDGRQIEYSGVLKEYSTGWVSILDCSLNSENNLPLSDASRLMMQRKMDFNLELERNTDDENKINFVLEITNRDDQDIAISHIEDAENYQHPINKILTADESIKLNLNDLPDNCLSGIDLELLPISLSLIAPERQNTKQSEKDDDHDEMHFPALPDLTLVFDTFRDVDIYIPRSKGLLRHGSEFID